MISQHGDKDGAKVLFSILSNLRRCRVLAIFLLYKFEICFYFFVLEFLGNSQCKNYMMLFWLHVNQFSSDIHYSKTVFVVEVQNDRPLCAYITILW